MSRAKICLTSVQGGTSHYTFPPLKVNLATNRYVLNYRHPIPRGSWLGCLTTSTATLVFPFKASREVAPVTSKRIKEKYKWQNRNPIVLNSTCGLHCPSDCSSHPWIQIRATPLGSQLLPFFNFGVTEGGQAWKAILLMIVYNVFWDVFYGRICSWTN